MPDGYQTRRGTPYGDVIEAAGRVHHLNTDADHRDALAGALWLLKDQLIWSERQHDTGRWHVQVTMDGSPVFGNDGHLLSEDVNECRWLAFLSFLECVADPELNTSSEDEGA